MAEGENVWLLQRAKGYLDASHRSYLAKDSDENALVCAAFELSVACKQITNYWITYYDSEKNVIDTMFSDLIDHVPYGCQSNEAFTMLSSNQYVIDTYECSILDDFDITVEEELYLMLYNTLVQYVTELLAPKD